MDWKNVVGKVAPMLGTALTGPFGGAAIAAIAEALGLSDKTESAIKQVISGATPEQMLAIKQADQAFAIKMRELGFANERDLAALAANDRDSARKREMALKDNTPKVLTYLYTIAFFAVIITELYIGIKHIALDVVVKSTLDTLFGVLLTVVIGSKEYYLGTSASSDRKTDLLVKSKD